MTAERNRFRASARARILGWYVVLLAVAGIVALLVLRQVLLRDLDDEVEQNLVQETEELRVLADGRDPGTGEPFGGNVGAVFDTFLRRNLPLEGEVYAAFLRGRPYLASASPYPLLDDRELVRRWASRETTEQGEVETPEGPLRFHAVPLLVGDEPRGVFVVGHFLREDLERVDHTVRVGAVVWGSVLVGASLAAWVVAGRVLRPVRLVSDTAREITATDLRRRIPVGGDDEVAALARTFNAMLDRLQSAFEGQRAFLDDAGHELRTPITVIRGHLELLGDDPDERRETVAVVTDELDRMSRMVDDLLVLARAEQPDFLRREQVDLDILTGELVSKAEALGDRDWRVEATGHGVLLADRQRLVQAVMNLAENALRHSHPGDPVWLGSSLDTDEARLWVRDAGPGVAAEEQERIFERFTRVQRGSRRGGAAGLGLAIVTAVAEAHGGRVLLESAPGLGATFTIVVPVDGERI